MGPTQAASAATVVLRAELAAGMRKIAAFELGTRHVEVCAGNDSIWAIVRRPGKGGVALRLAHCWSGCTKVAKKRPKAGELLRVNVESASGAQTVVVRSDDLALPLLRVTTTLTPRFPLLIPFYPRDLYPLGEGDDPLAAQGQVEAAQRGLNGGLCYLHIDEPAFGSVLYFQNLTALNGYFVATGTTPDGAVGGRWPELGYLPPSPPQSETPPTNPLPAGVATTVSDAIVVFHDGAACDEQDSARRFVQMLAAAYRQLETPSTLYRDWVGRADRTLRDLQEAPEATIRHYGKTYIHPYTASEYPDIMVQMSIISALRNYAAWIGSDIPFCKTLEDGLDKFHDPEFETMRRYLPNTGQGQGQARGR